MKKLLLTILFSAVSVSVWAGFSGDSLGNHKARKDLDMQGHAVVNTSSIAFTDGTVMTSTTNFDWSGMQYWGISGSVISPSTPSNTVLLGTTLGGSALSIWSGVTGGLSIWCPSTSRCVNIGKGFSSTQYAGGIELADNNLIEPSARGGAGLYGSVPNTLSTDYGGSLVLNSRLRDANRIYFHTVEESYIHSNYGLKVSSSIALTDNTTSHLDLIRIYRDEYNNPTIQVSTSNSVANLLEVKHGWIHPQWGIVLDNDFNTTDYRSTITIVSDGILYNSWNSHQFAGDDAVFNTGCSVEVKDNFDVNTGTTSIRSDIWNRGGGYRLFVDTIAFGDGTIMTSTVGLGGGGAPGGSYWVSPATSNLDMAGYTVFNVSTLTAGTSMLADIVHPSGHSYVIISTYDSYGGYVKNKISMYNQNVLQLVEYSTGASGSSAWAGIDLMSGVGVNGVVIRSTTPTGTNSAYIGLADYNGIFRTQLYGNGYVAGSTVAVYQLNFADGTFARSTAVFASASNNYMTNPASATFNMNGFSIMNIASMSVVSGGVYMYDGGNGLNISTHNSTTGTYGILERTTGGQPGRIGIGGRIGTDLPDTNLHVFGGAKFDTGFGEYLTLNGITGGGGTIAGNGTVYITPTNYVQVSTIASSSANYRVRAYSTGTVIANVYLGYELDAVSGASMEIGKTNATLLAMGRTGARTDIYGSSVTIRDAGGAYIGVPNNNSVLISAQDFNIPAGDGNTEAVRCDRTITSGNGLSGGGSLTGNRTLDIGAGAGITVLTDSVAVANTYPSSFTIQGNARIDNTLFISSVVGTGDALRITAGASGAMFLQTSALPSGSSGLYLSGTDANWNGTNGSFSADGTLTVQSVNSNMTLSPYTYVEITDNHALKVSTIATNGTGITLQNWVKIENSSITFSQAGITPSYNYLSIGGISDLGLYKAQQGHYFEADGVGDDFIVHGNAHFYDKMVIDGAQTNTASMTVTAQVRVSSDIFSNGTRKIIDTYEFAVNISSPYSLGALTSSATLISPFRSYAYTISTITVHSQSGTSVACMVQQRPDSAPDSAGTNVWTANVTGTTAGWIGGTFADNTVPANSALYLLPNVVSGNVDFVIIRYTITKD